MMPAPKKAPSLLGDDIIELTTKNDVSKDKIGSYDGKLLDEPKTKRLNQSDNERKAYLIMSRMKIQIEKHWRIGLYILYRTVAIGIW